MHYTWLTNVAAWHKVKKEPSASFQTLCATSLRKGRWFSNFIYRVHILGSQNILLDIGNFPILKSRQCNLVMTSSSSCCSSRLSCQFTSVLNYTELCKAKHVLVWAKLESRFENRTRISVPTLSMPQWKLNPRHSSALDSAFTHLCYCLLFLHSHIVWSCG